MTIFLYQVFAFNITIRLTGMLIPGSGMVASVAKAVFCFVVTIPICAGLAVIFGRIEKLEIKHNGRNILKRETESLTKHK